MQSLLFPSADSAKKLDKAMTSGADALIIDLEDSMTLDSKARARESARLSRPRSGLTDADLDAIVPARPDVIMLPKAEGGASVVHADASPRVRRSPACPTAHIKMIVLESRSGNDQRSLQQPHYRTCRLYPAHRTALIGGTSNASNKPDF